MNNTEIIYGTNPVLEVLRAGKRRCHDVYIAKGRREKDASGVRDEASRRGVTVKQISREDFGRITPMERHQGIAAAVDPFPYTPLGDILKAGIENSCKGFIVILDGVKDPQNLGSLVRTAHLMGVDGMIIPRDNAAQINATVTKVSAGATEYLRVAQVTNITNTMRFLKEGGFWIVGAESGGAESIYAHDFTGYNVVVVLGSEGAGIRRLVRERCDYILSLPMRGIVASYNVSVAGALFMGEIARQRWISAYAKCVPK